MLVCGGEDRSAKDQILLCGGADTSGTEPDHALWWKRDVNLHWRTQDVCVVREALLMGRRRRPDGIGHRMAGFTDLTVDNARDAFPACLMQRQRRCRY